MNRIQYIPYGRAHNTLSDELVVVDSHYSRGLVLAHVYEPMTPLELQGNTSTDAVLNWLTLPETERLRYSKNPRYVTCNHFDIDGLLAVWSVINPELALANEALLRAAAMLGDFREFDHTAEIGLAALRLCCLINAVEADNFCLPFGDLDDATIEHEVAEQKFPFFLPLLAGWIRDLGDYEQSWKAEVDQVLGDIAFIVSGQAVIEENGTDRTDGTYMSYESYTSHESHSTTPPNSQLSIITTPRPLHYYAAFSQISSGAVLTHLTSINYFEFEYRYETRVQRVDRRVMPRRDLTELSLRLTALEHNPNIRWTFDNIQEGGPMLRPGFIDRPLSREARYQSLGHQVETGFCPSSSLSLSTIAQLLHETCVP